MQINQTRRALAIAFAVLLDISAPHAQHARAGTHTRKRVFLFCFVHGWALELASSGRALHLSTARVARCDAGVDNPPAFCIGKKNMSEARSQRATPNLESVAPGYSAPLASVASLPSPQRALASQPPSQTPHESDALVKAAAVIQKAVRAYLDRKRQAFQLLLTRNKLQRLKQVAQIRARFREICFFLVFLVLLTCTSSVPFQDQDIFQCVFDVGAAPTHRSAPPSADMLW